jgi:phosphoribosylformimino-5-aminoimidazole carboxamide ribotide isomerase
MQVIPSIDLEAGRSRLVFWPGAATGAGAPTDRPEQIAARFVEQGARIVHLVDFDGARAGQPRNLEAVGRIAARVAVPLQLAGGLEDGDAIRLAFAAGATRAVVSLALADEPERLRDCLAVAGDWLAVGLDPRPERLAAFAWRRPAPPTLEELVGELVGAGVHRFVLSHGGSAPDLGRLPELRRVRRRPARGGGVAASQPSPASATPESQASSSAAALTGRSASPPSGTPHDSRAGPRPPARITAQFAASSRRRRSSPPASSGACRHPRQDRRPSPSPIPSPSPAPDAIGASPVARCQPASLPTGETRTVTIQTDKGDIAIRIEADLSPIAAGNFVALAGCGFYDGVVFHRVATLQDGTPFGPARPHRDGQRRPGYRSRTSRSPRRTSAERSRWPGPPPRTLSARSSSSSSTTVPARPSSPPTPTRSSAW